MATKRIISRDENFGPVSWASPVHMELGLGWAVKLLIRKKSGQIWLGPVLA